MLRRLPVLVLPIIALAVLFGRVALPARPPAALGAFGAGPTVVLIHGLGSRAEHWLPVARNLARDHRVVLVELPGHGMAEMPHPLTLAGAATALERALDEQCTEPAVIVGHSVGGLVAAAEALHSPQRVRALVLVETALRPQLSPGERAELFKALDKDYRGTLRANYAPFGRDSVQGAELFTEAARLDSAMLKDWIHLAVTTDLSRAIERLGVPLMVVLSDRSWTETESWDVCGKALGYERVPGVTAVRVENTGHFIMLDRPGLLADLVRRFTRGRSMNVIAKR